MIKFMKRCRYLILLLLAAVCGGRTVQAEQEQVGLLFPSVSIGGRELNQSNPESVGKEIEAYIRERLEREITLSVGESRYRLTAEELGLRWSNPELTEMIAAACQAGGLERRFPVDFMPVFSVDQESLRACLLPVIQAETTEPVNGEIYKEGERLLVSDGSPGRNFSIDQVADGLVSVLEESGDCPAVYELPYEEYGPEISFRTLSFSEIPLGEYTTYGLGLPGRAVNIQKSSEGINGTLVMPGETYSALAMYGPVTAENGYQEAAVYSGGNQITGIGGGICQTTTTLYNATLLAELEIVFRRPHSMLVSYVPPSMDAMVDYASGSDFVARNNTDYPVYLESSVGTDSEGRDYINVRIWGTETRPENRSVEYVYELLAVQFPEPLYRVNEINDSLCIVGEAPPEDKVYLDVDCHPFVQSRAYKVVTVDGVQQSREALPGGYGSYDQYSAMPGKIYHASDYKVTYWVVEDADTWLGQRIHYQITPVNQ